jgi:uncharacterized membrane protein
MNSENKYGQAAYCELILFCGQEIMEQPKNQAIVHYIISGAAIGMIAGSVAGVILGIAFTCFNAWIPAGIGTGLVLGAIAGYIRGRMKRNKQ